MIIKCMFKSLFSVLKPSMSNKNVAIRQTFFCNIIDVYFEKANLIQFVLRDISARHFI